MNIIIDHLGLKWTRSEDLVYLVCENGRSVMGAPYMSNEYLLYFAYMKEDGTSDYPYSL